jgi:hypothetical protein
MAKLLSINLLIALTYFLSTLQFPTKLSEHIYRENMPKIKRVRVSKKEENDLLTGMIISTEFLRGIKNNISYDLLENPISNTIVSWCLEYYNEFEKAPNSTIQDIFQEKTKNLNQEHILLIEGFLNKLSEEYEAAEKYNYTYELKKARRYLSKQSIKNLSQDIKIHLNNGDVEEAEKLIQNYESIKDTEIFGVNPFSDVKAIRHAFSEDSSPLFRMQGALGQLINPDLCRESFIGILGSEKIGKTWSLMQLAITAYRAGNNVAFFQCGDMSEAQQIRRIAINKAKRSHKRKYCGNVKIPVLDCNLNQINACELPHRICNIEIDKAGYMPCRACYDHKLYEEFKPTIYHNEIIIKPLTWREACQINKKFDERIKGKEFKLSTHVSDTLTVSEMLSILHYWEQYDKFVPDVIIIDYADLMDETSTTDFRQKENKKWKGLRGLAQIYKCLVITATQANADSYGKKRINKKNFSEDKRKFSHTTAFFALSRTVEEEKLGVIRWSALFTRDDELTHSEVTVLQSLQTGQPYIDSFFGIINEDEMED